MGLGDKLQNAVTKLTGKAKEATESATGDNHLKYECRGDQVKADL